MRSRGPLSHRYSIQDCVQGVQLGKQRTRARSNAFDVETLSPKRAKRIVANREAAHRSRTKKVEWIRSREEQIQWLYQENSHLMNQLTELQSRQAGEALEGIQLETVHVSRVDA